MEINSEIQNVINCLSNLNKQVHQNSFRKYTLNDYIDKLLNYIYIENLCLGKINNIIHNTEYHCFAVLVKMFSKINKTYLGNLIKIVMNEDNKSSLKSPEILNQGKDRLSLGLKTQEKLNPSLFGEIQSIYNREYLQAFEKFFDNLGFSLSYAQRLNDYKVIYKENQNKQNQHQNKSKKGFCQKSYEREMLAYKIFKEIEDNCYENFDEIKDPLLLIEISKIITKEMQKDQNMDIINNIDEELLFKQVPKEENQSNILQNIASSFNFQFSVISQMKNIKDQQNLQTRNRTLNDIIESVYQKFFDFQQNLLKQLQKQQNEYLLKRTDKKIQTDQDMYTKQILDELEEEKQKNAILIEQNNELKKQTSFLQDYQQQLQKKYNDTLKTKMDMENLNQFQVDQNLETFHQNNIVKNHLQSLSQKLKKQKKSLKYFFNNIVYMLEDLFFGFDMNKKIKFAIDNPNFDIQVVCDMIQEKLSDQLQKLQKEHKKFLQTTHQDTFQILSVNFKKNIKEISPNFKIIFIRSIPKYTKTKANILRTSKEINIKKRARLSEKQQINQIQDFASTKSNIRDKSKKPQAKITFRKSRKQVKLIQNSSNLQDDDSQPIFYKNKSNQPIEKQTLYEQQNILKKHPYNMLDSLNKQKNIQDKQNDIKQNPIAKHKKDNKNKVPKQKQNFLDKDLKKKDKKIFEKVDVYIFFQYKNGIRQLQNKKNDVLKLFQQNSFNQNFVQTSRENFYFKDKNIKSQNNFYTMRKSTSFNKEKQHKFLKNNKQSYFKKSFRIQLNKNDSKKNFQDYLRVQFENIEQYIQSMNSGDEVEKSKKQVEEDFNKILYIYCKQLNVSEYNNQEQAYVKNEIKKLIRQFSEKHFCKRGCDHENQFLKRISKLSQYLKNRKILKLPKYNITGQFLLK